MPASSSARSSICPAGPTNGLPARSSLSPGCSPTSMIRACCGPSPNTVCVASFQSGQARQAAASSRRVSRSAGGCGVVCGVIGGSRRFCALCGSVAALAIMALGGASGACDQRFNQRGLRQVPPVFLRHFVLHRLHLQPGRIEDAGVIAPPGFLQPVFGRRLGLADARRERDRVAVPMRAEIRRQDRPGHVGEAAGEERRGQFDDVMLRLEPGDEMRVPLAADFAEADEGVHLVLVAPHRLGHRGDLRDIGIGRDLQQVVMAAQPPQQAIEHGEALGIAMQDRDLRQFDEFGRDVEGAVVRRFRQRRRGRRRTVRRVALHAPGHIGRLHVVEHQRARGLAPAVEIGFAVEGDEVHRLYSHSVMRGGAKHPFRSCRMDRFGTRSAQ